MFEEYKNSNEFSRLDWQFADMVVRRCDGDEELRLLAAMTLCAVRNSHSCLDLTAWHARPQGFEDRLPAPCLPEKWHELLDRHPTAISTNPESPAPLILDIEHNLLYLNRFYRYEQKIAEAVKARTGYLQQPPPPFPPQLRNKVHSACKYFSAKPFEEDYQQQAVATAVSSDFTIITGGPGTGKTTVLAVILSLELQRNPNLRIALCAPTGKAAARMKESVARELAPDGNLILPDESIRLSLGGLLPQTLHNFLAISPETGIAFRNRQNPAEADLVVVDECSMSSLELVYQLFEALPQNARLILIGDQNQLASVEAGVVFAELCECRSLQPNVCRLVENHRSKNNRLLCDFVAQVIREDGKQLSPVMREMVANLYDSHETTGFQSLRLHGDDRFASNIKDALSKLLKTISTPDMDFFRWSCPQSIEEAFDYSAKFKILCAIREGDYGVLKMNELMRDLLSMRGPCPDGLPVLVTRNEPVTGLRNGDVGICFGGKIHFKLPEGFQQKYRSFSPVQLPPHEDAFAMTIHKSQGSDYPVVLMVLPDHDNPIMTRELVYTGITRTKQSFFLIAEPDSRNLETAILRKTQRWSGLQYRL